MTRHVFTRTELYAMVWAEPLRTLASRLGVSDVALGKACKRADIPTPERGYWAKLAHGKATAQRPLPERPDLPDRVVLAPLPPKPATPAAAQAVIAQTPPPAVVVSDDLRRAHAAVRAWVEANTEAWRKQRREGWGAYGLIDLKPPLQQRRLRLYSALFKAIAAAGVSLKPARDPDGWSEVVDGNETIEFRFYLRQRQSRRLMTPAERKAHWDPNRTMAFETAEAGDLVLKIKTYTRHALPQEYRETKRPLEEQLGEIVVGFQAGLAELLVWQRERDEQTARWEAERQLQMRKAAYAKAQDQRREALLAETARWRQAADLRAMVAAAETSPAASEERFAAWRTWALAQAEALDPLTAGTLDLSLLEPFDSDAGGSRTFCA